MRAVQTNKSPAELSFSALLWRILQSSMRMQEDCWGMHTMHMWDLNIHFTRKTDVLYFKCTSSTWQQFQSKQTPGHASYARTKDRTALCHARTFLCTWSACGFPVCFQGRVSLWRLAWFLCISWKDGLFLSVTKSITNIPVISHTITLHTVVSSCVPCSTLLYFRSCWPDPVVVLPFSCIRSLCFHSSFLTIES